MNDQNKRTVTLVVDLDGTLIKQDMFFESFWSIASKKPLFLFTTIFHLRNGISAFKKILADYFECDPSKLS